jgi:hypothetical protein
VGKKLALIAPSTESPVESLQIYEHVDDLTFKAPKQPYSASPGQEIVFIDGPDGEKIFVDSHKGKNKRFTFSY